MAPEKIDQIMEAISPESKDVFEEYRTRLIEQGIEKGIEQGLKEIAVNMISKGYSDEQIVEITNLSIKRIQILRQ